VDARELELAYQPMVDAATGEVHAFETLLRWNRPGHGVVTAERLIPVLEETGWIVEVGEWVLRTACRDVAFLREAASRAIRVAVNISSRQLAAPDFVANVAEILADAETPPGAIDLEITESTVMETAGFATSKLQELAAIGVRIALDDFGIGYSSLGNLDRLPVQLIKIDRSLVAGLGVRRSAGSIVEAIVTLAKGLGLSVVAEGIENQTQLELLDRLGCGLVQGNLFSAPLALAAAAALLQSPKPDHESR
jgi:EAL domain-containing protein (putative c-di-GMP-specific phosphodiesterase class I)